MLCARWPLKIRMTVAYFDRTDLLAAPLNHFSYGHSIFLEVGIGMHTHPEQQEDNTKNELRRRGGRWLRDVREMRALSQRDLASRVGSHYTFISAIESGRGRISPARYLTWANALEIDPSEFVCKLMSYYEPTTYGILFEAGCNQPKHTLKGSSKAPTWLSTVLSALGRRRDNDVDTAEVSEPPLR
jgi:transcriptional regulator with XRE-family HTH domain